MEIDREKGTNWKETFTFHSLYFQIGGWITYRDWWNAGKKWNMPGPCFWPLVGSLDDIACY
jgi:hypothetical protein